MFPAVASFPEPLLIGISVAGLRRAMRLVVVTDQRIVIFRVSWWNGAITDLLVERPRDTVIGPPHSLWMWYRTTVLGECLWIARRWFTDVKAADVELRAQAPAAP